MRDQELWPAVQCYRGAPSPVLRRAVAELEHRAKVYRECADRLRGELEERGRREPKGESA